ncbi:2,4-diaminopentanoate dehydrogenase [Cutibacterium acnes JCM 18916]|nr:2,4-diaminopentanoate dehydrogenase [Cutibacterium acnes JCM 18916]
MTATNPIRVVQWGLGAMGQGMAKLITAKDGLELVGAIDVNPALDGKDIGEVLGIDPLGANVTTDPAPSSIPTRSTSSPSPQPRGSTTRSPICAPSSPLASTS